MVGVPWGKRGEKDNNNNYQPLVGRSRHPLVAEQRPLRLIYIYIKILIVIYMEARADLESLGWQRHVFQEYEYVQL
jgi:hypothetical protein